MSRIVLALVFFGGALSAQAQEVRVRLFEGRSGSSAHFTAGESPLRVTVDGVFLTTGESAEVESEAGHLVVSVDGTRASGARVEIASDTATRVRAARFDRLYRGQFVIAPKGRGMRIVNHIDVEPYVASVVASEYPFREIEGVKALAVLARTYALRHRGDHADWDVDDSQRSQVYKGEGVVTEITREATAQTAGLVLRHSGDLVEAVYSSSNGGYSAANEDVWSSTAVPYLRALPDPFDAESPQHRWSTSADASRVHRALSRYGRVEEIYIERAPSGHLRRVRLEPSGREISGAQFRSAINASLGARTLRSTNVDVRRSGGQYVFEGGGFGHGVGMSQYGARGRAKAGHTYDGILAHYFPGTALDVVEGGAERPLVAVGTYRTRPQRRAEARQLAVDSSAAAVAPVAHAQPEAPRRRVVEPDRRPAWVVREALPNGDRVRSRPTPRREARQTEPDAAELERRGGWK